MIQAKKQVPPSSAELTDRGRLNLTGPRQRSVYALGAQPQDCSHIETERTENRDELLIGGASALSAADHSREAYTVSLNHWTIASRRDQLPCSQKKTQGLEYCQVAQALTGEVERQMSGSNHGLSHISFNSPGFIDLNSFPHSSKLRTSATPGLDALVADTRSTCRCGPVMESYLGLNAIACNMQLPNLPQMLGNTNQALPLSSDRNYSSWNQHALDVRFISFQLPDRLTD
ncbi:hypothetical protein CLF_107364 [Clonorchis sinensis]|uniref:Uncharacterized protein n=1 Tax=Clonorchis sinensis TaxID=79923 RepID=G7YGN2_CLOSI|nr:hypothetical protein CLF_107364 [Clonorchis sinensis]